MKRIIPRRESIYFTLKWGFSTYNPYYQGIKLPLPTNIDRNRYYYITYKHSGLSDYQIVDCIPEDIFVIKHTDK